MDTGLMVNLAEKADGVLTAARLDAVCAAPSSWVASAKMPKPCRRLQKCLYEA